MGFQCLGYYLPAFANLEKLMYEMFLPTSYSLDGSKSKMLQYTIDTYGGETQISIACKYLLTD